MMEKEYISAELFSPFQVELPHSTLTMVTQFVRAIEEIKNSEAYIQSLQEQWPLQKSPKTPSLLTSFDFHYNPEMGLKLIEINTNASLYLSSQIYYETQGLEGFDPELKNLFCDFSKALDLMPHDTVAILDREPEKEGLYFEFLLYREWLQNHGFSSFICSLQDYSKQKPNKIYNRYTDFYLTQPESADLSTDYWSGRTKLSPSPREYFLLADKKRLSLYRQILLQTAPELAKLIPESRLLEEFESAETLWANRKKYFLKPSDSFGGKGVFSGKGISRKAFDEILHPHLLAQELCPPGRLTFKDSTGQPLELKYDLRFFAFEGNVRQILARFYQGQTTNMRTPYGGIAPVIFV